MPAHTPESVAKLLASWNTICMRLNMHEALIFAKNEGLTLTQIDVMHLVCQIDGCDLTTICHHLAISRSAASQLVDRLYREDLLTRTENPADRRSKIVALTPKGAAIVARHKQLNQRWMLNLSSQLDSTDLDCVARTLEALTRAAQSLDIDQIL